MGGNKKICRKVGGRVGVTSYRCKEKLISSKDKKANWNRGHEGLTKQLLIDGAEGDP